MARTCALIAPFQPILHQVWCSNERLPNAPKHYETHKNMSLGSNGVDWVDSLQKNPMQIRGTNFCINCSLFCTEFHAASKQSKMHPNTTKHTNTCIYCPMGWIGCVHCEKLMRLHGTNLYINCTGSTYFAPSFM